MKIERRQGRTNPNTVHLGVSAGPGRRTGLKITSLFPGVPSGGRNL